MSPVDTDRRHCSSCEKVITDFSKMSDDELMLYFRHSKGNTCGLFSNDQLNRRIKLLPEQTQKARWWKTLLLLPLTLFSKNTKAQTDSLPHTDSMQTIITENDSLVRDEITGRTDTIVASDSISLALKSDSLQLPKVKEPEFITVTLPLEVSGTVITTLGFCTGPTVAEENGLWIKIVDSLFPSRIKRSGDQLNKSDRLKQLADHPEKKPEPAQPALPASNDLNAILPEELRKSKRT
jgi:hypothetical protein